MNSWFFLIILPPLLLGLGLLGFALLRRHRRSLMGYERGLKMVILQIYLPPVSDSGGPNRDQRDVIDENISKSQALYNILASTFVAKGFKVNYYGQQHFGFEVIASGSRVYFYAVAPVELVGVIKQAIVSAYPTAKVDKTNEHNLFNPTASIETVVGGEVVLKEHFSQPIATYIETKQDTMKSVLQALINVDDKTGVGLQILIRPAAADWVKDAQDIVKRKRSGIATGPVVGSLISQAITSVWRPPEEQQKEAGSKAELSGLDQELIQAIESKTAQAGFEVLMRLIVSSPNRSQSQMLCNNLTAALALFDRPGHNGLKFSPTTNPGKFVESFNLRFFPVHKKDMILNATELASIFHLPDQTNVSGSQVERQTAKQVDGPRDAPEDGLMLGHNVFREIRRPIRLGDSDRMRHTYVVGQTGTGKSVFLESLMLQDMKAGRGFALVDPHGETAETILAHIPQSRLDDVVYFNPAHMDNPMGLNIFEHKTADEQDFLIQEAMSILYKLYDPQRQGIIGPRYEYMFRNAAKLIMADPAGGSFIDVPKLFNDKSYVAAKLKYVKDRTVLDFWQKEVPASERSSDFGEVKSWFVSKFSAFLGNDMMRNIIGQAKSSFNLRQIMDEGKILIVNLSKGLTGELNSKLLGMLFVTKFQMAATSRADVDPSQRPDFTLFVDEFQNFATDSFASILSEARKYRLALVVANQHTTQLSDEIREAVFGNVGTAITFRVSAADAENMVKQFYNPVFEIDDLTRLPVGNVAVRTLINGVPTAPFSMETLPPIDGYDLNVRLAIEQKLMARHGRPRAEVEAEIFARLAPPAPATPPTVPSLPPDLGNIGLAGRGPQPSRPALSQSPTTSTAASQSDFLEGWLAHQPPATPAPTQSPSAPTTNQSDGPQPS